MKQDTTATDASQWNLPCARSFSETEEEVYRTLLAGTTDLPDSGEGAVHADLLHLREALGSYRVEVLHWAERRSAAQPSLLPVARRNERRAAMPQWALALVALVTILGGVAHFTDSRTDPSSTAVPGGEGGSTAPAQRSATPADIAADNRLLSSINAELDYHSASPVDALGLQEAARDLTPADNSGASE